MSGFFPFSKIANIGGAFFGAKIKVVAGLPPITFRFQSASGTGPIIGGPQNVGGEGWTDGRPVFNIPFGAIQTVPNPPVMSGGGAISTFVNAPPGSGSLPPFAGNTFYLLTDPGFTAAKFNNIVVSGPHIAGSPITLTSAAGFQSGAFTSGGANFSLWVWPAPNSTQIQGGDVVTVTMNF